MGAGFRVSAGDSSLVTRHPSLTLVPPVVAHLYHAVLDAHREFRHWLVGRRRRHFAGADVEARAVAHALDFVTHDAPAGQLSAVMSAHVLDRVVLATEVEYGDARAVGIDQAMAAGLDFARFRYGDPI